ncbi:MAG: helix-turn-helix domain-containing protein [Eubacteriaceae bacterium]
MNSLRNDIGEYSLLKITGSKEEIDNIEKLISCFVNLKPNYNSIIDKIEQIIIFLYGYTFEELKPKIKKGKLPEARQLSLYLIKEYTDYSLSKIGNILNRDHTTVLSSIKVINNLLDIDRKFKALVNNIKNELNETIQKSERTI